MALRYLAARRSALSYVSRLALFGLILSVAVLVVVISVVNGFERELRDRVLGVLPQISAQSYTPVKLETVRQTLASAPLDGVVAAAPYVTGTVLLVANENIQGVNLAGVTPSEYEAVTDLGRYTQAGDLSALNENRFGIILGAKLARTLGVSTGERVLVVLPIAGITPAGVVPRQRRFTVVDIFDSQSQADGQAALINLAAGQKLFRTGERVHGVHGRLVDLFDVNTAATALYNVFDERQVRVSSWQSTYGNLYQAIAVQKLTMFILLSFLIAVAAFNLVSGLMMIVEQRKHDVAVLRTLGAPTNGVMLLFCMLGGTLSLTGIAIGLVVGLLIALGLPVIYSWVSSTFSLELMTQYFIAYLPVDVRAVDLMYIVVAALTLAFLASIYPAWRATRLVPSKVLAHE